MILCITRKYPPSIGGMQKLSYRLTTEFAARRPTRIVAWGGSQTWLPYFSALALFKALRALIDQPIEIVHLGDPVLAPIGFVLRRWFRVPTVVTVHGLDVTYPNRAYQWLVRRLLPEHDAVIAISREARQACLQRGVAPGRCHVVPVGVDREVPVPLSRDAAQRRLEQQCGAHLLGKHILLTTGRLVRRKGVAHFVEATLPLVLAREPEICYLVVGDGPDRERIRSAVRRQGLAQSVVLLGAVDEATLWAAYQACDLFVMPNVPMPDDIEGFGLVTLEAGVAGRCVVASDLEGIRDAVHDGHNGVLMPSDQPTRQASTILRLLDRDEEREAIGRRAREFVGDRFNWARIADQYLTVFDQLSRSAAARRSCSVQP